MDKRQRDYVYYKYNREYELMRIEKAPGNAIRVVCCYPGDYIIEEFSEEQTAWIMVEVLYNQREAFNHCWRRYKKG